MQIKVLINEIWVHLNEWITAEPSFWALLVPWFPHGTRLYLGFDYINTLALVLTESIHKKSFMTTGLTKFNLASLWPLLSHLSVVHFLIFCIIFLSLWTNFQQPSHISLLPSRFNEFNSFHNIHVHQSKLIQCTEASLFCIARVNSVGAFI